MPLMGLHSKRGDRRELGGDRQRSVETGICQMHNFKSNAWMQPQAWSDFVPTNTFFCVLNAYKCV